MAKKRKRKTREPRLKGRRPTRTQPARACKRTYATAATVPDQQEQVREVNIRGGAIGCYVSAAVCTELVRGLASSARSDLEKLHIACYIWRQSFRTEREEELLQELLQALLRALPRLTALREL
ncbi:hypothetical protein FOCC_FOCC000827, partial [Frankliniella occidentalis]